MCGRFTLQVDLEALLGLFPDLKVSTWPGPRYNIAPTQPVATVPNVVDGEGHRTLTFMRWGLIPSWAKDPKIGSRLINARGETAHEKPSFRAAFKRRRCLVLADGFYEWHEMPGQRRKQPVYIHMASQAPFGFAGLWEQWHDPAGTGDTLTTCTIITTEPNAVVKPYHNRMPAILPRAAYDTWLAPGETPAVDDLRALIGPYPPDEMEAYPVSTQVNRPDNDSPECIVPLNKEQE